MSPKEEHHEINLGFEGEGSKGHFFATDRVHRIALKGPVLLLQHSYHDDVPVADAEYELDLSNGSTVRGHLDKEGKAEVRGLRSRPIRVRYGADPREYTIADDGTNPAYLAHFTKADADSLTAPPEKRGVVRPPDAMTFGLEAVDWIWGTVKGGFNEKQTVSQILVDAVIGMIPLVGDVTAVRDLLAILLGMARDPEKRESKLEWLGLVVLLFALLPVVGGAIKGVGKLLLKGGRGAAEASTSLRDIVAVLNRLGLGDAPAWFKALNLESRLGDVLGRWRELMHRLEMVLDAVGTEFKGTLPEGMLRSLSELKGKIQALARKGEEMIPNAVKELDERLKAAQRQLYEGEWHDIPKNLASSTREVEARLIDVPGGKKWTVETMAFKPNGREAFFKREGWPDLSDGKYVDTSDSENPIYQIIPCFSGPMRAVRIPPGTKIYRVVDKNGIAAGDWWVYALPESGKEWREGLAVLDFWNENGFFVEMIVPEEGLLAWEGKAASQIENDPDAVKTLGQYLPGGQIQLFIDLKFEANAKAMEALSKKLNKPLDRILEKKPTPWTDNYYGLHVPEKETEADFLGPFEIESKNRLPATLIEKSTRRRRQQEE
ncbi:MAG TPA: hypothetical protein VJ385_22290 [Fibrobacteria bacterium]|nr:hypothetical protein [Fibrobacteria bacterium]